MNLNIYKRGPILRYGVAIIAVLIAMLASHILIPIIGLHQYLTIYPAILVVAVLAGRNPAILTGVLGGPAAALLFEPVFSPHVIVEILIVIGTAAMTGWLVQRLHNARAADRQILGSIPGMVFTTRPDGYCDYMSEQWVDYTGVPAEEQLGDAWNKLLHPDDRRRVWDAWRAAVEERAPYDVECRIRRHDGHHEWFKVRSRPIRNTEGRIVRWFGVVVNIDAFKRTQEDLLKTKNELETQKEDLLEAKEKLETQKKELEAILHIVSHDLRAPLLNIRGFSDILRDDCRSVHALLASEHITPKARKHLDDIFAKSAPEAFDIIEISATAMHSLIDSLVTVARAGLVVPKPEVLDMTVVVKDIVASIGIKFKDTGVRIDIPDLPPCFADPTHAAQIFRNLIDNAIKYRHPARTARICIEGARRDDHVLYWVSDNGLGIDSKHEQRIFDIFYRVDGKTGTGEGIGLSVVKRMVERNGGRIWLVSEEGKGSNFFVELPLPPDGCDETAKEGAHRQTAGSTG